MVESFINDFRMIMHSDEYVNKKKIDAFFDKYSDIVFNLENLQDNNIALKIVNEGYKLIEKKNERYVQNKLIVYKDYFDNMFKGIDEDILLDEEQRRAILTDEDYSLVIAGAGSGKTTTMAAKVKYLVDIKKVKQDRIILLAFTNKACSELASLINGSFNLDVEVLTFHKLGMKFLREIFKKPLEIAGQGTFNIILKQYITEYIFKDKDKLKLFIDTFDKYVHFDDKCFDFDSYDDYYKYYVNKVYLNNKYSLDVFCNSRIRNRYIRYTSITGERFKSRPEVIIANYLYKNSINYAYEKMYPNVLKDFKLYHPDFTIDDNGKNIYVEYYGLLKYSRDGKYEEEVIDAYKNTIKKKRKLHEKYGTDLIELYSEYDDTNFITELDKELSKRKVTKNLKTYKDIFYKLMYTSTEGPYYKLIGLFNSFIYRFKEEGKILEDFNELILKCDGKKEENEIKFIKEFFIFYENKIHSNYQVDFPDMINYAYKNTKYIKDKYDYIIIDEYQDISKMRYQFAKRISDLLGAKIVAVGDDWQAIYGFSGSDIELFTNFYNMMGYADIIKIQNTYRNSQELLDLTTDFVSKNTQQFTKKLKSNKHLKKPVEIIYYDDFDSKMDALVRIISHLKDKKILLLGRFNFEKEQLLLSDRFKKGEYNKIICNDVIKADIDFLTVHKSKGTGYDEVILLNGINDKLGFPSQIVDDNLMRLLNINKIDLIEYPEERRLFYVALTRTKNKVYILTPKVPPSKRSDFIREIENNENVIRKKM